MKNKLKCILLSFILWSVSVSIFAASGKITSIKVTHNLVATQIQFQLTVPTQARIFTLSNPERLVLDFPNTQLAVNLNKISLMNSNLQNIRIGHPKPNILRIVMDLNNASHFKNISHNASEVKLEIFSAAKKTEAHFFKKLFVNPLKQSLTYEQPIIIVVDPGHGGKDAGAVGERGTREKDVVLAISKELVSLINRTPGMHAVLTREGDYFVTLHNRLVLARKGKADLFVAIHADSYFNNHATGASVFTLSQHGATSIAARWLAMRDNYSELEGVNLGGLEDQSYLLRSVLIDLAQTNTTKDSLRLGDICLGALGRVTPLHHPWVEQAPFLVLKSPDIPSVLIETGFISNQKEESRLRDKAFQHKIALAILSGIREFHNKYYRTEQIN